ncbi:MAG TPA: metallophosphoesterase family protein [Roseiflexaceae bacterium]|nr:metallophosphoesterase family protein [Roseiflexaceae bacterium]
MRIAILADIHGNQAAFEAALEDATRQRAERLVIAGDVVVGAPDSAACWQLACSLGCPILRGNHEGYVAGFDRPDAPAAWRTPQFAPVQWAAAQLTPDERRAADALPPHLRPADLPGLLLVHASLRNDRDSVSPYTTDEELAAMFPDVEETLIVRAHNHAGQVRLWGRRTVVTTGSVGLALDGNPTAQYLLLEQTRAGWTFRHQSAPYDVAATLRRFRSSGYLEAAGPMARLYQREVATGAHQIVPFLRAYSAWSREGPLGLEEALERFLKTV